MPLYCILILASNKTKQTNEQTNKQTNIQIGNLKTLAPDLFICILITVWKIATNSLILILKGRRPRNQLIGWRWDFMWSCPKRVSCSQNEKKNQIIYLHTVIEKGLSTSHIFIFPRLVIAPQTPISRRDFKLGQL